MIWPFEMVPWSMHKTNTIRNGVDRRICRLLKLVEYGSMVHNQTIMNENGYDHLMCRPPRVLLENGSIKQYGQTTETISDLLENVRMVKRLARMTLKAKMKRNRSTHHVPIRLQENVHAKRAILARLTCKVILQLTNNKGIQDSYYSAYFISLT